MSSLREPDAFFRSHFEHVNRLADRSYEQVRAAYQLGQNAALADDSPGRFEEVEQDLENGWLNVRVGGGDWASVREFVRAGFDYTHQGRIHNAPAPGESPNQPPYADPLGGAIDPTIPDHPERL